MLSVEFEQDFQMIREQHAQQLKNFQGTSLQLNELHDETMLKVMGKCMEAMGQQPPCRFSWFIAGSGGRYEQSFYSDQDHGIVYEEQQYESYFKQLGVLLSQQLAFVGYAYCDGGIMPNNTTWCESLTDWQVTVETWLKKANWESLRYAQILFDSRTLVGEHHLLEELKAYIPNYIQQQKIRIKPYVLNVAHIKVALGPLGQFLVERYGKNQGLFDLKYTVFVPIVNTVRILSIMHDVKETSTLARMRTLKKIGLAETIQQSDIDFEELLQLRLKYALKMNYEAVRYIEIKQLSKDERKFLKNAIKEGRRLHKEMMKLIE